TQSSGTADHGKPLDFQDSRSPLEGEGSKGVQRVDLGEGSFIRVCCKKTPHPFECAEGPDGPLPQGERASQLRSPLLRNQLPQRSRHICSPIVQEMRGGCTCTRLTRAAGASSATSMISLVRIASLNCARSRTGMTKAPGPPITQSS